jgi:hypothetical protein
MNNNNIFKEYRRRIVVSNVSVMKFMMVQTLTISTHDYWLPLIYIQNRI